MRGGSETDLWHFTRDRNWIQTTSGIAKHDVRAIGFCKTRATSDLVHFGDYWNNKYVPGKYSLRSQVFSRRWNTLALSQPLFLETHRCSSLLSSQENWICFQQLDPAASIPTQEWMQYDCSETLTSPHFPPSVQFLTGLQQDMYCNTFLDRLSLPMSFHAKHSYIVWHPSEEAPKAKPILNQFPN